PGIEVLELGPRGDPGGDLEQRLLGGVLRVLGVTEDLTADVVDPVLAGFEEGPEVLGAGVRPAGSDPVGIGHRHHRPLRQRSGDDLNRIPENSRAAQSDRAFSISMPNSGSDTTRSSLVAPRRIDSVTL